MAEIKEQFDDKMLLQLAKMADCRSRASVPDVDAAWDRFRSKHIEAGQNVVKMRAEKAEKTENSDRAKTLKMWLSAIAGAAAMLVGVIIYNMWNDSYKYLALEYDETPRMITLSSGNGQLEDLTDKDSVSFFTNDVKNNASVAADGEMLAQNAANDQQSESMQTLSTPRGMDFKITLHDGTEVWLNAESTIEFPSAFTSAERNVNLRGEAYFKVARNESKPFNVNLGDKTIRVLGTEFNVRNYAAEQSEVVLVKGSVQLCNADGEEEAKLTPGKGAYWMGDKEVAVREADTYAATQWIDGLFYFEEHSLGVVLREVGRWYNYGVQFENGKHLNYKIHYSADRNDDIEHIIDDLNTLCGFKIALDNKNIVVY